MTSSGLLKIQDDVSIVFAYYLPIPTPACVGGYLGWVPPGGYFYGLSFEFLRALGTGEHEIEMDEHAHYKNAPPTFESDLQRDRVRLRFEIFSYLAGGGGRGSVVIEALEFAGAYSVKDLLAECPQDLQTLLADECVSPPETRKDWIIIRSSCVSLNSAADKAAYERGLREQDDKSYRGYCRLHEHFHKPRKD